MTITITKRGYWCLRVVYTSCQGLESDGRNFLAAIVQNNENILSLLFKNLQGYWQNDERPNTIICGYYWEQKKVGHQRHCLDF
jgi:hypothetical protein